MLINLYLLGLFAGPLIATLLLVLPALLMERLLRLFGMLAGTGSPASSIARLLLYLLPHYLGLALPAALFLAVYSVVARLAREHELDALQALGFSLLQLSRPFLLIGVLFALGSLGLYGYVQPVSRYAFRAALHALTHAGWNATLVSGEFTQISRGLMVYVEDSDAQSGALRGIVVQQHRRDGTELLTSAQTGRLLFDPSDNQLFMELEDGQQISRDEDGKVSTLTFSDATKTRAFVQSLPFFRGRGADERELTLGELWNGMEGAGPPVAPARLRSELHARLARAASLLLLPVLAMPMGLAAKRSRHSSAIILGALILVLYQQSLQLFESLGDVGRLDPRIALWGMVLLFAAFSIGIFRHSNGHPNEGAFDGALDWLDRLAEAAARHLPRRRRLPG